MTKNASTKSSASLPTGLLDIVKKILRSYLEGREHTTFVELAKVLRDQKANGAIIISNAQIKAAIEHLASNDTILRNGNEYTSDNADPKKIDHRGAMLFEQEVKVLLEIEQIMNTSIPKVEKFESGSCGFMDFKGHVIKLKLFNDKNHFLKYVPESIENLINLEELLLSALRLSTLPESIGKLTFLKKLLLGSNPIYNFPQTMENLQSLEELGLYGIFMPSFPDVVTRIVSLKKLLLGRNQLNYFPKNIANLVNLKASSRSSTWMLWKHSKPRIPSTM
ncbi:MAG TPA: hypothetical protein VKM55_24630 [Candidatus Lokiarchaeia archaeon]|nr:hypothetical protein [Candidatus Lokiarchaeia archaeon]